MLLNIFCFVATYHGALLDKLSNLSWTNSEDGIVITQGTPGMERLWESYGKAVNHTWKRDLAYTGMEELESCNGTTLSLGLDLTSPSPDQRVFTQEAAGMIKLWESYEKAMKK